MKLYTRRFWSNGKKQREQMNEQPFSVRRRPRSPLCEVLGPDLPGRIATTAYGILFVSDIMIRDDPLFSPNMHRDPIEAKMYKRYITKVPDVDITDIAESSETMRLFWPGHENDSRMSCELVRHGVILTSNPEHYPAIYFELIDTALFESLFHVLRPEPGVYSIYRRMGYFDIEAREHHKKEEATFLDITYNGGKNFKISVPIPDDILKRRNGCIEQPIHKCKKTNSVGESDVYLIHHVELCDAFLGFPYHPIANDWVVALFYSEDTSPGDSIDETDLTIEIRLIPGGIQSLPPKKPDPREDLDQIYAEETVAGIRMGNTDGRGLFGSLLNKDIPIITITLDYSEWKDYLLFHQGEMVVNKTDE